jgi:hypothetical protein
VEKQFVKLSGLKEGYLVEYNGDNPQELSNILTKYLSSYGELLKEHTLFVRSGLDEQALNIVRNNLEQFGFSNRVLPYKQEAAPKEEKRERIAGKALKNAELLFRMVTGPLRGGENIYSNEGVFLWGDLHKDGIIKAPCVIVMGKAAGKVVVPEGSFALFRQCEGASVQVGDVLYVDISSKTWILVSDTEPNTIEVFTDEKQAGRRISQWLDNVLL